MATFTESAAGVYIIAPTPFTENRSLDFNSIDRMVDFFLEKGVDGITALGMMGEAPKMTIEESREVVARIMRRAGSDVPVVVGVSAPGFADMQKLSQAVMDDGAAGVMIAPPKTLKMDHQIVQYYHQAADAIGADVPFVLQDYPLVTGIHIAVPVIAQIVRELPNCVCLKHEDWPGLAKISALRAEGTLDRRISILCGLGGLYLPEEMQRGADGAMTGFSFPEMMVDVVREANAGNPSRAQDLFDAYLPLARYEQQPGLGLAIRKYVLQKRGVIENDIQRLPGSRLDAASRAEVDQLIERQERRLKELH